jgi:hypothetical protein
LVINCDDNNDSTEDICDPGAGCQNIPIVGEGNVDASYV